jgi:hypothetical protein
MVEMSGKKTVKLNLFDAVWMSGTLKIASVESPYGTVGYTPGQVQGGRWKPLQYFYERYLFRDVLVACSSDGRCLVKNDNALAPVAATAAFAARSGLVEARCVGVYLPLIYSLFCW